MGTTKYHYAYNENNIIIDIKNVSPAYRQEHCFYCISCGAEMIAKLGKKNKHHFAHKGGDDSCNSETYLHKLGKLLLKKKFYESSTFEVEYKRNLKCKNHASCPFYEAKECFEQINEIFDLKKYYDTCTEEQTIGEYRADLLCSDSLGKYKDPVLIEIRVTHECTLEKKKSGMKIIEIQIKSDDAIWELMNGHIKECDNVKFMGFLRESKEKVLLNRYLSRLMLFQSGAAYVEKSVCNEEKRNPNTILELNFDPKTRYYIKDNRTVLEYGFVTAIKMGYNIKNCMLCKYCRPGFDELIFCCMSKKYGTPKSPKQAEANKCIYYNINKARMDKVIHELSNVAISIVV